GIGGDLFALVYIKKEGRVRFLNGSGRTPAAADPGEYVRDGKTHVPQRGIRSVTVPGCVDAWCTLHEAYGSMTFERLVLPAAELARRGYPISHVMARIIRTTVDSLEPHESWRR